MKLNLPFLNVRGLNEGVVVDSIQAYIRDSKLPVDIVAVHEHKLQGSTLD